MSTSGGRALLFGLSGTAGRGTYAAVGFGLAALKYAVDSAVVHRWTGELWSPFRHLSPLWTSREQLLGTMPGWAVAALGFWTLPFLWIGVNLTRKRALDAGLPPWLSLLFFVPLLNFALMAGLCLAPSRTDRPAEPEPRQRWATGAVTAVTLAVVLGLAAGGSVLLVSVYVAGSYGLALFAGSPFLLGVVAAAVHQRSGPHPLRQTLLVAALTLAVACCALLLLALEGVVCIVMALPLALPATLLGAVTGTVLARQARDAAAAAALLVLLPGGAGLEADRAPRIYEARSAIEIDAPRERVWEHVVGFSELPPPSRLLFRTGIAWPRRARMVGTGVGAVRYCEFSTGPFVEPITRWQPPERLSFDVAAQPPAMQEWSPWSGLAPPHLDAYFRSVRGEFRLIDLGDGRTRLEGSTWYALEIRPAAYWRLWSDAIVHRIHQRVLEHVRRLAAESTGRGVAGSLRWGIGTVGGGRSGARRHEPGVLEGVLRRTGGRDDPAQLVGRNALLPVAPELPPDLSLGHDLDQQAVRSRGQRRPAHRGDQGPLPRRVGGVDDDG